MKVDHGDIVRRIYEQFPPLHTPSGAVVFVLQVINALPRHEGAGLLQKTAGDNIVPYNDTMVSAGRICYPDGQIYKLLTDIPTTMAPVWDDDGTVDPARYVVVDDMPSDDNDSGHSSDDNAELTAALVGLVQSCERIVDGMSKLVDSQTQLRDEIHQATERGVRLRIG